MKLRAGYFLSLFCLAATFQTIAQIEQPRRFEYEIRPYEDHFDVINGGEQGLMLVRSTDVRNSDGAFKFELIMLDTSLNMRLKKDYFIDRYYEYRGYDYFDNSYYLLFKYNRKNSQDLKIIKIDIQSGDTTHFTLKNLVDIQLTEFEMTQGAALIGGYYNYSPLIIYFNTETNKSKVLPGVYQNRSELVQLKVDDDTGNFIVIMSDKTYDKRNTLAIKTYDSKGDIKGNTTLVPDADKGLVNGYTADFNLDVSLLGGTYSSKRSTYSRGIFLASVDNFGEQEIKYYNYADLENFFDYMRAKRRNRVSHRIERKKIKGKKIKFNYRLLVHDIIKVEDQYVMLGEAFYPKYSSSSGYSTFVRGPASYSYPGNYGMYFIGYRYTHAVVVGFNDKGEVLWDNSFEIDNVLSYNLDQFVHVDSNDERIVLLYLYDNEIRSKIIKGNEVLEGMVAENIQLSFEDDEVQAERAEIESLEPWYDNNFYAYGTQNIKNVKNSGVKLNRRVFYINKIRYK